MTTDNERYATQSFPIGARVKLTWEYLKSSFSYLTSCHRFTVVGYSRDHRCVRILRDGTHTPRTYHVDFVETAE